MYIKPSNEQKTTFYTNYSLFKPLVIFFKITNSLVIFQTIMNNIFWDLIVEGIVVVYLIFTRFMKEHIQTIWRVLEILAKYKLFLHSKKYKFQKEWIKYLGLVILENKVSMDTIKVAGVHEWPIPGNWMDVQVFLGFINFYQRFIQGFSMIACSLFDLIHSN